MLIALIFTVTYLIGTLFYVAWIHDHINNPPHIPETEEEKLIRNLKLRIADTEWKIKRKNAELNSSIIDASNNTNFGSRFKGQDLQRQ